MLGKLVVLMLCCPFFMLFCVAMYARSMHEIKTRDSKTIWIIAFKIMNFIILSSLKIL